MKYYEFGDKTGRYVGRTEKYDVYTSTLTEADKEENDNSD